MSNPTSSPAQETILVEAESSVRLDKFDDALREGFAKDIVEQSTRLDELAKQLITAQLAIPGLFAAVLKLVRGETATVTNSLALFLAYTLWLGGLLLTLWSLIPKDYTVDRENLTAIENYFTKSAQRKRSRLIPATICTFLGILFAVWSIYVQ